MGSFNFMNFDQICFEACIKIDPYHQCLAGAILYEVSSNKAGLKKVILMFMLLQASAAKTRSVNIRRILSKEVRQVRQGQPGPPTSW